MTTNTKSVDDLLEIPGFLRRDPTPSAALTREPKRKWIMPKKSKAKSKPKRKTKAPRISDGDRWILRSMGWTDKVLTAMPKQDIEMILNKQRHMQSADEVNYLTKTTKEN